MTINKAGRKRAKFVDRCSDGDMAICRCFGERNVTVDGHGQYCMIIDRETSKNSYGDVSTSRTESEACWPKSACIPIKKGSVIDNCGEIFVAAEKPIDQHDGWYCVALKLSCENC